MRNAKPKLNIQNSRISKQSLHAALFFYFNASRSGNLFVFRQAMIEERRLFYVPLEHSAKAKMHAAQALFTLLDSADV